MNNNIAEHLLPIALIVDDDLSLRLAMGAALKKVGFEVVSAESGQTAVELFQEKKPDIILLDVLMPEMDGFQTCKAIRQLPGGLYVQIIMVTGLDDTESIEKAFEVGANDFIAKPINWTMLGHRGKYILRAGRALKEVHLSRNRLAKTQELAKLGNWQIELDTLGFRCSPEACRLLGIEQTPHTVGFENFLEPIIHIERETVRRKIEQAARSATDLGIHYRVVLPSGSQKFILNQAEIVFDKDLKPEMMLGVIQDVSQLKRAEEEIRQLAFYDSLTGLANRSLFMDHLEHAIALAERSKGCIGILFLDLDQFSRINDILGHQLGDLLLKQVAATIKGLVRKTDIVSTVNGGEGTEPLIARLGGDEFTLILPDIKDPGNAALVANRLISAIDAPHRLEGQEVSVTSSIGISIYPNDGKNPDVLLKNAISAMQHAKSKGRSTYKFFTKAMNKAVMEHFLLERDMKKAIANDEFTLYYQPQIRATDRKIIGAEALIRWNHPTKGLVPPDKFIKIAEESGRIIDINKWVIQTACKQNSLWQQDGLGPIRIAVNLSGYELANQNITLILEEALTLHGIDAANLEVEITENILMQDSEETLAILRKIKDLRLRISLDDFGTGYSSLSYLTAFSVDSIKIDRSFVLGCTEQNNNRVIIKAIIAMGHSLGMKIVAEGVETEDQFNLIKAYGCDEVQGYLFSRPVPQDEFISLLKSGYL